MISIEYATFDIAANEQEFKETLTKIHKYPISILAVLPYYIKCAKSTISQDIAVACPIDYPCGILDIKSRVMATESAIKAGANIIDVVVPSHYLSNRKYDKFREDVKNIKAITDQYKISLRYILEYRVYSYELLYRICQILIDYDIETVLPSTGFGLDEIADNIIAAALINKKLPALKIVCNGNIWTDKHVELIQKANLPSIRVNSANALELLYKKMNTL